MTRISALFFVALLIPVPLLAADKVGVLLPLTGDFARYGERVRVGIERAAESSEHLLFEDEGCSKPATAISAFRKLSSIDEVRLFLGPMCGSPQVVVAPLVAKGNALAVLGSSAPERVFELSKGRMLSVQHSIEQESEFNAQQIARLGVKRVVILSMEHDYGRAHEASFRKHFKGQVLETLTYTESASALRSLIPKISILAPEALYVPDAAPFLHGLLRQLNSSTLKELKIFSVYAVQSEDVLTATGSAGQRIVFSYPKIEGDALEYFPGLATKVLKAGLLECKGADPQCVLDAIRSKYKFDQKGILVGELALKTMRDGAFVWYEG